MLPKVRIVIPWQALLGLVALVFMGHACTQAIKEGQDFSSVGIQYADAMTELIELTTDTVIDDDSDNLLYTLQLTSLADKDKEKELLETRLKEHDESIKDLVTTLGHFRGYTATLKTYFVNLQALSGSNAPESATMAVAELSASINHANKTMLDAEKLAITEKEKEAFGALAGLAAKGVKSAKLGAALRRDAPIIDEQLLLQEKLLAKLAGILKHSARKAYINGRKENVLKPYKNKKIKNPSKWKKERKRLIKSTFFVTALDNATKTARQMRLVWGYIVEGETSLESIGSLISDINEMTAALHQLKEAAKEDEGGAG